MIELTHTQNTCKSLVGPKFLIFIIQEDAFVN